MEFALCLDEIGSEDLYLHVSRPPNKPDIAPYLQTFLDSAEDLGINLDVRHARINVSDPISNWQHELFSKKRIVAATLSSRTESVRLFHGSSMFDNTVDNEVVIRNIHMVAEALCKIIYPHSNGLQVLKGSQVVNKNFVDMWMAFLSKQTRVAPYLTKDSDVIVQIQKVMSQYTSDWKRSSFTLNDDPEEGAQFTFYQHPITSTVSVHLVKPITFDLYLSISIVAYLAVFHYAVKSRD